MTLSLPSIFLPWRALFDQYEPGRYIQTHIYQYYTNVMENRISYTQYSTSEHGWQISFTAVLLKKLNYDKRKLAEKAFAFLANREYICRLFFST